MIDRFEPYYTAGHSQRSQYDTMKYGLIGPLKVAPWLTVLCLLKIEWGEAILSKPIHVNEFSARVAAIRGLKAFALPLSVLWSVHAYAQTATSQPNILTAPLSTPTVIWLLIFVLLVVNAISVGVSFYLYRWRRLIIGGSPYLVPEKWARHLDKQHAGLIEFTHNLDATIKKLLVEIGDTSQKVGTLSDEYMTLRGVIDDRDFEIKRLKRGYDRDVYVRFLKGFIRLDAAINEKQHLELLSRLSQDALDECGVECFSPATGSDYRTLGTQVADNPKTIATIDASKDFLIVETLQPGYLLRSSEDVEVIVSAKVSIYRSAG